MVVNTAELLLSMFANHLVMQTPTPGVTVIVCTRTHDFWKDKRQAIRTMRISAEADNTSWQGQFHCQLITEACIDKMSKNSTRVSSVCDTPGEANSTASRHYECVRPYAHAFSDHEHW